MCMCILYICVPHMVKKAWSEDETFVIYTDCPLDKVINFEGHWLKGHTGYKAYVQNIMSHGRVYRHVYLYPRHRTCDTGLAFQFHIFCSNTCYIPGVTYCHGLSTGYVFYLAHNYKRSLGQGHTGINCGLNLYGEVWQFQKWTCHVSF